MSTPPEQPPVQQGRQAAPHGAERERSRRETARTASLVVLAVLATVFAVLNSNEVKVDWIVGSGHAPLIVVIVISLLAGIVLTYLAEHLRRRRR
jgi:uncharacterized integral membrane protein